MAGSPSGRAPQPTSPSKSMWPAPTRTPFSPRRRQSVSASSRTAGLTRTRAALRIGTPLLAVALWTGAASASPGQVHAQLDRARAPESQLDRTAVRSSHGVRFYRYRQEVGGLPV